MSMVFRNGALTNVNGISMGRFITRDDADRRGAMATVRKTLVPPPQHVLVSCYSLLRRCHTSDEYAVARSQRSSGVGRFLTTCRCKCVPGTKAVD
jgi:hypothetical protein